MTDFTDTEEILEGPPPLEAGEAIAPGYEVITHLHRSNNFDIYDTWSEERASRCIAKTPIPDLLDDRDLTRGLVREGRLLRKLTHPHIVRAYETIKEPRPALILETLTGATLAYLIDTAPRRLPLRDIAHLGLHLCSAVQYLHRHGILHLDLKPSNIVSECQRAKILDLSIARPAGRGKKGAGTRNYMAPEQARGGYLSPAADVWGIGAVLFEVATGELPFGAPEEDEDRYEQLERRAELVRAYRRVPAPFNDLVGSCFEPEPAKRPAVGELAGALRDLVQEPRRQNRSENDQDALDGQ
jgi:eukaryotic-like serine/threonine-protein kinase